eukprot:495266-Prymnesium_polylepis.1
MQQHGARRRARRRALACSLPGASTAASRAQPGLRNHLRGGCGLGKPWCKAQRCAERWRRQRR